MGMCDREKFLERNRLGDHSPTAQGAERGIVVEDEILRWDGWDGGKKKEGR